MTRQPDIADPLLQRQLAMLDRLAEAGLRLADAIVAQSAEAGAADAAMPLARVSRAVRQCILLQQRLSQGAAGRVDAERQARKNRIDRIVWRVIDEKVDDPEEALTLIDDLRERLDGDDIYGDVLDLPLETLIARICDDLGLEPDWAELNEQAWAKELSPAHPPPPTGGEAAPRPGGSIPPPPTAQTLPPASL